MRRKWVTTCPVCGGRMIVSQLSCTTCNTKIEGEFEGCKFCHLPQDLYDFLEVFLKTKGVIKEIEKEMGISYPAVKNRIDKLLAALGYEGEAKTREERQMEVLELVRDRKISVDEAADILRKIR